MNNERRAILYLVAMGRITAAEAERLMLAWQNPAWQDARDWIGITILCLAACVMQAHPHFRLDGLGSVLHMVLDHRTRALHTAVSIGLNRRGGSV